MNNVELLAPAGNVAALHAAVSAGADAVYLGLEAFNARRGADNFTIETLEQACAYAHLRGVSVYVTMNTVVLPQEMPEALECARQAYRVGADAFIVQDIGLAAELTRTLPEARLHVSTQMNTHSAAGIRAAARLGAARVTLARELSLGEVEELAACAAAYDMEVETFAHGALCVCYSGQCFMSSMIGGRSANRGMCAQACRLPYELKNAALRKDLPSPGEHLLSPQDLCTVDLLPDLVRAGVSSLKIEGRMKSPEYVASVTAVYRSVLDRVLAAEEEGASARVAATKGEHDELAASFSRGFTTAYLEGERGNDIMSYQRPNNRGQFVGRVSAVRDGHALVASSCRLVAGDVVEFWTKKGHVALTLADTPPVKDGLASLALDGKTRSVRASDRVFRVRSAEAAFADDALEPRVPVSGRVTLRQGAPLSMEFTLAQGEGGLARTVSARLGARFASAPPSGYAEGPVVEAARTKAVTAQDVRAHVDRLGSTPFVLEDLSVDLDEGVGIGFSAIHHCRAAALESLQDALLEGRRRRSLPRVKDRDVACVDPVKACLVAAWATNPVCARAAKRAGADVIYVPALNYRRGEAVIAGQLTGTAEQAGYPKQCVIALPVIDHDPCGDAREAQVDFDPWRYVKPGKPALVESLGALQRADEMGVLAEVGPHLPATNQLALHVLHDFGARRAWLSPELTLRQIEDVAAGSPLELGVTVSGSQELMVTEHCLLMSQGPCDQQCDACPRRRSPHFLKDRKGFEFPVVTDALGRSHLYNSVALDVVPAIPDLLAAGISAFLVDTTLMNGEQAAQAVGRAVRALKVAQADGNTLAKLPDTTSGHLYRGVS
ncbi:DUF3656 domain-containing protein [Adlercreutzia sp. ZJ242]|uniref:DUF3656 domain-containing U32 family peptidase n=1 Tax=Adlercreutzia sp. ZJ242 TaxID=2709409 RepID=UPI0013EB9AE4|nr:U32 family peptidase [Adlercreutzia sp. ZJ242]